jgi:hypothetical protein
VFTIGLTYDIVKEDKGVAVGDTERKRGEADANYFTYRELHGNDYRKEAQEPSPSKVNGFC